MNITIIPARGGSKRIPRKNVKIFAGRPMIEWPIRLAIASGLYDRVVVSTDDAEITSIALAAGAEVPFRRPADLADDDTPTIPVITHAIHALGLDIHPDTVVCCIYPTTPLLTRDDLELAHEMLSQSHFAFVFAGYRPHLPIQRAFTLGDDRCVQPVLPDYISSRTQDLPHTFLDAGQFYVGSTQAWISAQTIINHHATIVEIPIDRAIDIDTEAEWETAELRATRATHDPQPPI